MEPFSARRNNRTPTPSTSGMGEQKPERRKMKSVARVVAEQVRRQRR